MTLTADLLRAWGCPEAYSADYPIGEEERSAIRPVSRAANWYGEMDGALAEMVRRLDAAAIRAWAASDAWDAIAIETSIDGDGGGYAEGVRAAMEALADSL